MNQRGRETSTGLGEKTPTDADSLGAWLRELLPSGEGSFYHLGYSAALPNVWNTPDQLRDTRHLDDFRRVAEGLRGKISGDEARVLMVTDDATNSRARAFTAFQIARLMGEGGARVLLVDADFEQPGISDVIGEAGHEGWVDVARYGTSVRSSAQPIQLNSVELIGVGSFRPQEPLNHEELSSSLTVMRSACDFIMLVAPARRLDGSWNPLFEHADGVLLSIPLNEDARDDVDRMIAHLRSTAAPVFGVMAYTSTQQTIEFTVEAALDSDSRSTSPYSDVGPVVRRPGRTASSQGLRYLVVGLAGVLIGFAGWWAFLQWRDSTAPQSELALNPTVPLQDALTGAGRAEVEEPAGPEATVGVEAEPIDFFSRDLILAGGTPDPTATEALDSPGDAFVEESGASGADDADATTEVQAAETTPLPPATRREQTPAPTKRADSTPGSGAVDSEPTATTGSTNAGRAANQIVQEPPPASTKPTTSSSPDELLPEPAAPTPKARIAAPSGGQLAGRVEDSLRKKPVEGYALHVWSFPDSAQAVSEMAKLQAEGMQPIIQGSNIPDRGRWYRVLVGEYSTRQAALEARSLLSERPDVDYVGVIRVP